MVKFQLYMGAEVYKIIKLEQEGYLHLLEEVVVLADGGWAAPRHRELHDLRHEEGIHPRAAAPEDRVEGAPAGGGAVRGHGGAAAAVITK